jgi:Cys-tRNA(Pro)/Cys-tRNA(Cys) deacylase
LFSEAVFLTPAIRFLIGRGIFHKVIEYEHLEKGAVFASRAIGISLEKTIKTLVVELVPGGYCLVLMPGTKTISFKKLAQAAQVKRASLVDTHTAEKITGYLVGGISPFGTRKQLPVFMAEDLFDYAEVAINGGRRGIMLIMRPSDIAIVLEAKHLKV